VTIKNCVQKLDEEKVQNQPKANDSALITRMPSTQDRVSAGEPSELVLSRAMVAVKNGKAAVKEKLEMAQGQPKAQRNLVSIFSTAFKGSGQPREKVGQDESNPNSGMKNIR
jgi:hypothetical protein